MRCDDCDRDLTDDEPVWRRWRWRLRDNLCTACASDYTFSSFRPPRPCVRCGRQVHLDSAKTSIVACSPACQKLIYSARFDAKRDRRRKRQQHDCACQRCGDHFTAWRSDASCCSNRCRQALYRSRLAA